MTEYILDLTGRNNSKIAFVVVPRIMREELASAIAIAKNLTAYDILKIAETEISFYIGETEFWINAVLFGKELLAIPGIREAFEAASYQVIEEGGMQIILLSGPEFIKSGQIEEVYSLEFGPSDGRKHFDHHGVDNAKNPAPCNDYRIPIVGKAVVYINHFDPDIFVGLLRMAGRKLPEIDLDLLEQIDLNGSSVVPDKLNVALLYAVGIKNLANQLRFPRVTNDPVDVSAIIYEMMAKTTEEIVGVGWAATIKSEAAYINCQVVLSSSGRVGLWSIGADDPLDQSRPYEDGTEVVVVYREHFNTISIYCDPISNYGFASLIIAGVQFAGHPKACGSPRSVKMTAEDARRVFEEITNSIEA